MTVKAGVLLAVAATAAAVVAATASAMPETESTTWYWTPGLCKSALIHGGMELADGRTFYVANAFCVGWGGPVYCEWSSGYRYRLYTRFTAYVRSWDGTIRTFTLKPTNRSSGYTASGIKALGHEPSASRFNSFVAPIAHSLAATEQQRGCARYSP